VPDAASPALRGGAFPGYGEYCALMADCWAQEAEDRPGFEAVITRLRALAERLAAAGGGGGRAAAAGPPAAEAAAPGAPLMAVRPAAPVNKAPPSPFDAPAALAKPPPSPFDAPAAAPRAPRRSPFDAPASVATAAGPAADAGGARAADRSDSALEVSGGATAPAAAGLDVRDSATEAPQPRLPSSQPPSAGGSSKPSAASSSSGGSGWSRRLRASLSRGRGREAAAGGEAAAPE
jgi:hypothetical protein